MIDSGSAQTERLNFASRLSSALIAAQQPTKPGAVARAFNLLADGLPVTTHGVRKWLKGESYPTQEKILLLAKWLNVEPAWLRFGPAADKPDAAVVQSFSLQQITLLQDVASLTTPAQVIVRELVDSFLRIAAKGQIGLIERKAGSGRKPVRATSPTE